MATDRFYTKTPVVTGTLARALTVDDNFDAVATGFVAVATELDAIPTTIAASQSAAAASASASASSASDSASSALDSAASASASASSASDSAASASASAGSAADAALAAAGFTYYDAGNTSAIDLANGQWQRWAPTGSKTLTISNWPVSGTIGALRIEGIDLGDATITWPSIQWIDIDGNYVSNFADLGYSFLTAGTDFITLWTRDGGSTVWGLVTR